MGGRLTDGRGSLTEKLAHGVRRRPLLWVALLGLFAVVLADGGNGWTWLPLVLVGAAIVRATAWRGLLGVGLFALAVGAAHWSDVRERRLLRATLGEGEDATRVVRVLERPKLYGRAWVTTVKSPSDGMKMRLIAGGAPMEKGSLIEVRGRLLPLAAARNPGEFDTAEWLDRSGVFAVFRGFRGITLLEPPSPRWALGESIKLAFREAVTQGLDPSSREASVIRAVVLGEHPNDDVLIEPFRVTGTLHVFAVSGLHVGMVGLMAWGLLRLLGVSKRIAILPIIGMMFGYAWLTGMKPPAVRAAWMAAVLLGAFWFRRRPDMGNALGLAAMLVLAADGDLIFSAGVQLSFGVVLAIGLLHRPVSKWWTWMTREEPYLPRVLYGPVREGWLKFRRGASGMLTVSSSAWMGSAPLTAWHFGILTPIAVPASVLLGLMVFPLLAIALVSALLAPFPGVTPWLNQCNGSLARLMLGTAERGAAVPGGHVTIPRDRPGDSFLLVYDVGEDGAACWYDSGSAALVDGASRRNFERVVLPSMRRMGIRPQAVVATHPDGGHVGGLAEAMDAFPVEAGLAPVLRALGPSYRQWLHVAEMRGVPLYRGRTDHHYPLGEEAWIEVLLEPDPWNWHQLADDRTMPLRLHWSGWRILFLSDSGWGTEEALMDAGVDLSADVIVAGRHGNDGSLGSRLLKATGAQAVIASHADFPLEQRIPERWMAATEAQGVRVFHQGRCGAVIVSREEDALRLRSWLDGQELRISR